MSKSRKAPGVGRRAESGATPSPEGEDMFARQPACGLDISDTSENSAFRRSPADSESFPQRSAEGREGEEEKKIPKLTRALKVEISRPINTTWRDLKARLFLYRNVIHRFYNAAIFGVAAEETLRERIFELKGKANTSGGRAYQMVLKEQEELRSWGAKQKEGAPGARYRELQLSGGCCSAISQEAYARYRKWQKAKGSERLPSYCKGAPIPVRAGEYTLSEINGHVNLSFKLEGRDGCGEIEVGLKASNGSHWSRLLDLARHSPGYRLGEMKIMFVERDKKWMVALTYQTDLPEKPDLDPEQVLVIHRGKFNMLTAMSSNGHFHITSRGNKYLAQRRGLSERMRTIRKVTAAERGRGAKGHGSERRFATHTALQQKLDRVNDTLCKQLGARVANLAFEWGCGRVVIEDYGGIEESEDRNERRFVERFPFYKLKESIAWALRKRGLDLDEVSSLFISSECPACGNIDPSQANTRTGVFHCTKCGLDRLVDHVAAYHMLVRSGADVSVWKERFAQAARFAAAARAEALQSGEELDPGLADEPEKPKKGGARKPSRKTAKSRSPQRVSGDA